MVLMIPEAGRPDIAAPATVTRLCSQLLSARLRVGFPMKMRVWPASGVRVRKADTQATWEDWGWRVRG